MTFFSLAIKVLRETLLNGVTGAETAVGHDQAVSTAGSIIQDAAKGAADLVVDGIPGIDGKDGMTCLRSFRPDRKSTRLNPSHELKSRMPSSA